MADLLTPLTIRDVTMRHRLGLAPMSQYMASPGLIANNWHLAHYATRAIGTGLVIVEATAVSAVGAVTPQDLGLWTEEQASALGRIADVISAAGSVPGIQLSHAGRKASRHRWWDGDGPIDPADGGWVPCGPSPTAFASGYPVPVELDEVEIWQIVEEFATSARLALKSGFRFLELHAGHGRLMHSFYSPISNQRTDQWGGSWRNRVRLVVEIAKAVRRNWPDELPLAIRLSCVDWLNHGWSLNDSVQLAALLREHGVDLVDCTSGGIVQPLVVPRGPLYQAKFAMEIRLGSGVKTAAVGLITDLEQANTIIETEVADMVLMGRTLLLDPLLMLRVPHAGRTGDEFMPWPYARARTVQMVPDSLAEPEL